MSTASRLLLLPRELRDVIYSHLYASALSPNTSPPIYPTPIARKVCLNTHYHSISYPVAYPKYTLLPILQANRQLRFEFQEFLQYEKSKNRGLVYRLSAEPSKTNDLQPTWTVLPLPPITPYVDIWEVIIDFRIPEFTKLDCKFSLLDQSFWSYQDRLAFGGTIESLFRLLSDIFYHGPQGFYDQSLRPDGRRIESEASSQGDSATSGESKPVLFAKKLTFNLVFPELPSVVDVINIGAQRLSLHCLSEDIDQWWEQRKWDMISTAGYWFEFLFAAGCLAGIVGELAIFKVAYARCDGQEVKAEIWPVKSWDIAGSVAQQVETRDHRDRHDIGGWSLEDYRSLAGDLAVRKTVRKDSFCECNALVWVTGLEGNIIGHIHCID
ncbi:hypothetical protein ABW19_dt0209702 [Dactylella cylindrospora]|nr:hypothetical protein ABW19_dt0209702 [Dactylella cylindrospora]